MISDEVFAKEMDGYLKKQNISKKERNNIIGEMLYKVIDRDALLEEYRSGNSEKPKIPSEDEEQIAFVYWFKKTYPGIDIIYIHNGGSRTPGERTKQILLGLLPGASDLFIPDWKLWVEMKRQKGGVVSDAQKEFMYRREANGDTCMVGYGWEDAKIKVMSHVKEYKLA